MFLWLFQFIFKLSAKRKILIRLLSIKKGLCREFYSDATLFENIMRKNVRS